MGRPTRYLEVWRRHQLFTGNCPQRLICHAEFKSDINKETQALCLLSEMSLTFLICRFFSGKQGSAERLVHGFREHTRFLEDKLIAEDGIMPLVPKSRSKP